ncbi:MAG TPA: Rieske 2Fe-2S domain-containing protein, partial [Verrucomicrobiae bacterium]|nr:Rieske 2Fe-2S domain-containing protein [Verrucomicrobiae bacterium]
MRTFVLFGGWSAAGGLDWTGRFLGEVRADDLQFPDGTFTMRVADFPGLQADNGSVYLSVPGLPDLIINRVTASQFIALSSVCTHQACTVRLYNATAGAMVCPCHLSR